jgi:hypothetical protein
MTHDDDPQGVIGCEQARQAALTVPEREQEAYRAACQMAHARREPEPDREAHRARFYADHDYHPTKETPHDESR